MDLRVGVCAIVLVSLPACTESGAGAGGGPGAGGASTSGIAFSTTAAGSNGQAGSGIGNGAGTGMASPTSSGASGGPLAVGCDTSPPSTTPPLYVATNGDDSAGDGSELSPWRTIGFAIQQMPPGGTLLIDDGIYEGEANHIREVPSGQSGFTVVAAKHPLKVRIEAGTYMLLLEGTNVHVDGIVFEAGPGSEFVGVIDGDHNRVTRSIFRRWGEAGEQAGLLQVSGNDNLIEDVAGVGACRACFNQGGPDATTQRNIWRRVVGRMDYTSSPLPKSTFYTYGNNVDASVRDHLYQNVIAVDGNEPTLGDEAKYGGIGVAKNASNVRFQGVMVIHEGVTHAGIFGTEWGSGNEVEHAVVWGISDGAVGVRADAARWLTVGGFNGAPFDLDTGEAPDSLFGGSPAQVLENSPGATVKKRYGVSGTHWGDPGFDQLTDEDLWPWTCQAAIAEVFSEPNDPPPGNSPTQNLTRRGFTAEGTGLYGGPITLTSYLWELQGTPCPPDVCPAP